MRTWSDLSSAIREVIREFEGQSMLVHTDKWQSVVIKNKPEMATHELLNVSFSAQLNSTELDYHREQIGPNLPWADDHFLERVGGEPLNPGVQWAKWPWGHSADKFRDAEGRFNHNYMERYWPKWARRTPDGRLSYCDKRGVPADAGEPNKGLVHPYGDLQSVIDLLTRDPLTRQAYMPVFFPEDTGVEHGGRVPCTLGYHFIARGSKLHVVYYIRSCDLLRHFRDDIYLTVRLLLHVLYQVNEGLLQSKKLTPGTFTMHITSLHCFRNDWSILFP